MPVARTAPTFFKCSLEPALQPGAGGLKASTVQVVAPEPFCLKIPRTICCKRSSGAVPPVLFDPGHDLTAQRFCGLLADPQTEGPQSDPR